MEIKYSYKIVLRRNGLCKMINNNYNYIVVNKRGNELVSISSKNNDAKIFKNIDLAWLYCMALNQSLRLAINAIKNRKIKEIPAIFLEAANPFFNHVIEEKKKDVTKKVDIYFNFDKILTTFIGKKFSDLHKGKKLTRGIINKIINEAEKCDFTILSSERYV